MAEELDVDHVAEVLLAGLRPLVRRIRQLRADGDLTLPEATALSRLDRDGPTTSSALAKQEQIRPQSMGATLAGLEARGLVERRADPADGRRVVLSITDAGRRVVHDRRTVRHARFAAALSTFDQTELRRLHTAAPLIERLAEKL
ncbi:MAG TPA: MarR family transcriptional regulator [Pseudonocardiaceae bacterium]|jgi:DNA-binding MarR family transcriptional regulator|nr:MarR family transcriptional regulator [Pseudonocardiaceae bacterium]